MSNRTARFETTLGNFTVELFDDRAPNTAKNFADLAQDGYYDGLIFHRLIDGFMIQGGCPQGTGTGGPGYTIKDEFHRELRHDNKEIVSMANAGPNTSGSQFFITLAATPWLDDKHTVFGRVTKRINVVETIGKVKTKRNDRPVEEVKMLKVTIA